MATFSLGTTEGAPGVYINERAGTLATAGITSFSTVYMLVETEETAPVTTFPFNTPVPVSSLADYKVLLGGVIPTARIPLLSYNCVNEFFQNAQVGDLRVVRVGTPNQIAEVEFLPSGSKQGTSGLPSALFAGNIVYVQMTINGLKLVAGDGSTGYTANGEWLGVPVEIPVDYIAGDEANNRRIATAMVDAVTAAIESNASVRSSVYVREAGLVNSIEPSSNSENGFITLAATTYDANVSVITEVSPVGSQFVFTQTAYNVSNAVGGSTNLVRVPQDYTQCIDTAFDGQQDQGYLITPTAYAQFDAAGRALVGEAAALHCESNNFKWMALADPGPFLITDVNKYSAYVPHQAAADLVTGLKYLVDNAIYEWTGTNVTYARANYLEITGNASPESPISKSVTQIADGGKYGLLDPGTFTLTSVLGESEEGKFLLTGASWPSTLQIQEVTLSDVAVGGDFAGLPSTIYIVAPPYNLINQTGEYCVNTATGEQWVFIATTSTEAVNVLNEVVAYNGTWNITSPSRVPSAFKVAAPTGSTCTVSYATPAWSLDVEINGQTSNLIENISGSAQYINTNHLPATLQDPTETTRLAAFCRTFYDFNAAISAITYSGTANVANVLCVDHGLIDGQKVYLTQNVWTTLPLTGEVFLEQTTKFNIRPYYVKAVDADNFVLASDLTSYANGVFIQFPTDPIASNPGFMYSDVLGGSETSLSLSPLSNISMLRARKYGFSAGTIANEAAPNDVTPAPGLQDAFGFRVHYSDSSSVLSPVRTSAWGEDVNAGYAPSLVTPAPGTTTTAVENFYCAPTVDQSYSSQAYLVPAFVPQNIGGWDAVASTGSITAAGSSEYATSWCNSLSVPGIGGNAAFWSGPAGAILVGNFLYVINSGTGPNGEVVGPGDAITAIFNGTDYDLVVVDQPSQAVRDIEPYAIPFWGSQVAINFFNEQTPPSSLWRFDAITSTEIISNALRGVGSGGVPQASFIEAGVDNVNRLYDDSQRYSNPFGFIAYYGSYILNGAGQYIPPSPYVTGVALRRYRAEGYQFPPAGVKFQLADAQGVQISINSAQQNLLNPAGCNAIRTLPGYPDTAVYIWGGRTRVNANDAQQKLYQFVNTRVIMNVVYGSLRSAFDDQIFNVIDGFGVIYNQIISVGNSILNELYVRGALYGARPSDAFQVICDDRINTAANLENGIINTKVFVTPVPTLERIQIDLIRVAIGNMQNELDALGLGTDNSVI